MGVAPEVRLDAGRTDRRRWTEARRRLLRTAASARVAWVRETRITARHRPVAAGT
jgi:hypothetical protein